MEKCAKAFEKNCNDNGQGNAASVSDIVFAELVLYIEETRQDEKTTPIFKLTELAQLYKSRIEQLKVKVDTRINTTRLREMILAEFPDMQSYKKRRDVMMALKMMLVLPKPMSRTVTKMLCTSHVLHCPLSDIW